ncbi:MAG: PilZ domain-containing protein [Elusimicrobia bacterium]|nr:PilZ domain-containing protein [Elusimicrobiota bacterium]
MRLGSPRPVPALFEFPEEPERREAWGRFLDLRPDGATLLCLARVERGARLRLRFDLPGGSRLEGLEADVVRAKRDGDGYSEARLVWRQGSARQALHKALLGLFEASA